MFIRLKKSKKDTDQPFYFTIVSGNGNTVACSKMYSRKGNCRRTANSIQDDIAEFKIIDDTKD